MHTDEKVDEMEAETPEHLSELDNGDEQQGGTGMAADDSSKPSSPKHVAVELDDQPSTSGRKERQTKEPQSRSSDQKASEDVGASGATGLCCPQCCMQNCLPSLLPWSVDLLLVSGM